MFVSNYRTDDFEPGALDKLKRTTTYFVYGKAEEKQLDTWKEALNKSWKYTKLEFMSFEDFMKEKDHKGKSFLIKDMSVQQKLEYYPNTNQVKRVVATFLYGYLTLITIDKENKIQRYCRIELYPTAATYNAGIKLENKYTDIMTFIYKEAEFYNWYPGLVRGPISQVSDLLQNERSMNYYKEIDPQPELAQLSTKTLYIPDYAFNYAGGTSPQKPYVDIESKLSKYGYKVEVIDPKKLSKMIMESEEDLYVMLYMKSMGDKFITVWNGHTDTLLYKEFKPNKIHIKKKDFKQLTKAIRKLSEK
jgi:hypothetical protein